MLKWLRLVVLLFPLPLSAQDSCSCSRNLDRYIAMVTRNYAGFHDKVNDSTRARYTLLSDSLRAVAAGTTDKATCFKLLDIHRAFFWDKHLQLAGDHAPRDDGSTADPPRSTSWTASSLQGHFGNRNEMPRPLEGVWSLDAYRVGIVYNDSSRAYDAIIMASENPNWKEGMVKFQPDEPIDGRSTVRYWRGDRKRFDVPATYATGHLAMKGVGTWHMIDPPAGSMNARTFEFNHGEEVQWKLLDDHTLYIKPGSCDLKNKAVLDSLVKANRDLLDRIPTWIVDFRGNGGGSTDVFQSLLPYLYTKPMTYYGASHWMSPENTALLKKWYQENKAMLDKGSARHLRRWLKHGEKHPNTWFIEKGGTARYGRTQAKPQRIAILADHGTASSGESFLEVARGTSAKTVIFGENTGGYKDYGDLQNHDLGCDGLVASIPTSRMNRIDHGIRYDLVGIAPDVRIAAEEPDWIDAVRRYWAVH